jgi:hypothetical protein
MAENSLFFEAIIAQRSMLIDEETALEGGATVSLETQSDMAESDVLSYIEDNFIGFLTKLRYLSLEDQELLLGYYVLAKTQESLALLHRSTQTLCSARIRKAMQKLGAFMIFGDPTAEILGPMFVAIGIEHDLSVPLSSLVEMYASTRSFQRVAEVAGLHRPDIRRAMSQASKLLSASGNTMQRAIGAYIFDLIDKASASGHGYSTRKMAKQGNILVTTTPLLGEFRIDVNDPTFDQILVSRANR